MNEPAHAHSITVTDVDGTVRVELDGELLAESSSARMLREGALPPRYYVPFDDVRAELLERTATTTFCPFKGDASYWTVVLPNDDRHDDIVWSYEEPIDSMKAIEGMLSFYNERVTLLIDGEAQESRMHRSTE